MTLMSRNWVDNCRIFSIQNPLKRSKFKTTPCDLYHRIFNSDIFQIIKNGIDESCTK